ncbi:CheA signal transduction histidine kinase [Leptospira ryugenii]|uniref:Chemotaxis protein CheA n=1 Tax=Leptospira ryugenii TaxID=1917863 RepID=A0A2P2DV52_9LEPT|nr:response regulator [Leptospira ryugenii]GBF48512.1 CheA signal transduction histidine kinase [Leptospira ryugenii]
MKIEDDEIREIFESDSLEHIQKIESGILDLEQSPTSSEGFKSIFREAHSLKGSAGILGLKEIESITHVLEEYLSKISKGYSEHKLEDNDRIFYVLDQLKLLVNQAVTGEKAKVDIKKTVEILLGKESLPSGNEKTTSPKLGGIQNPAKLEHEPQVAKPVSKTPAESQQPEEKTFVEPQQTKAAQKKGFRIETMRVDPEKLDILLSNTGELIVAKNRIQKRSAEISELLLHLEEFSKFWRGLAGMDPKAKGDWDSILRKLTSLKVKSQQDATKLDLISNKLEEGVQKVRLLPLSSVFEIFPRVVRDISRELGKEVYLTLEGGDVTADKLIIEECKDSLMHLVRNSLDHGIETREERESLGKATPARIKISGNQKENFIYLVIEDDGRGLDLQTIKEKAIAKGIFDISEIEEMSESQIFSIIFHQGFSTRSEVTNISGRGYGMDIVRNFADRFKGTIEIESSKSKGTKFTIKIPTNFSTSHVLIIGVNGWKYGIPTEFVKQSLVMRKEEIRFVESKPTIRFGNEPVRVVSFSDFFPVSYTKKENIKKNKRYETCIILEYNGEKIGILIDYIYEKQEILLKPFIGILDKIHNLSGTTILESGEICCIVNIANFFQDLKGKPYLQSIKEETISNKKNKTILIIEDSLITRAQLQRIIESDGYPVLTAINGQEGLEKCKLSPPDLILTDIEMPVMDGFGFISELKKNEAYQKIPIVILTSLGAKEHIERGKELGADSYLVKSQFDQSILLKTVERLVAG